MTNFRAGDHVIYRGRHARVVCMCGNSVLIILEGESKSRIVPADMLIQGD